MTVVTGGGKKHDGASLSEGPHSDGSLAGGLRQLFPFLQSPQHLSDHVSLKAKQVADFWKKAPVNYPERYVNFTKKMVVRMETTAVRSANFAASMVELWMLKPRRD